MNLNNIIDSLNQSDLTKFQNIWKDLVDDNNLKNLIYTLQDEFITMYQNEIVKWTNSEINESNISNYNYSRLYNVFFPVGISIAYDLKVFYESKNSPLQDNLQKIYDINQTFDRGYGGYNANNQNGKFRTDTYNVINTGNITGRDLRSALELFKSKYNNQLEKHLNQLKNQLFIEIW